jgi:Fe2+ transport system protein FeoA
LHIGGMSEYDVTKNYYNVLGLPEGSSLELIKSAYIALALKVNRRMIVIGRV